MAQVMTIDTLKISKKLQSKGLDKNIADTLAETFKETQEQSVDGLATKQDIVMLESKIELAKKDIIIKLGSIMSIGIGLIAFLIKF